MRLGQLARKLEVKTADIVSYLANEHKTEMNVHPNSKVDDKLVPAISEHFGITQEEEVIVEKVEVPLAAPKVEKPVAEKPVAKKTIAKKKSVVEPTPEVIAPKNEIDANGEEIINPAPEFEEPIDYDSAEHIETEKPEALTGLKVVAKIDLPPPPPPEMIEVDGVMMEKAAYKDKKAAEQKAKKQARSKSIEAGYAKRSNTDQVATENIFTTEKEEKKKDKHFEVQQKKKQEAIAKKRAEHYKQKHAITATSIAPKKKKKAKPQNIDPHFSEELVDETTQVTPVAEAKLGGLARLWKWFNT
jgi:hypothetical protein